MNLRVVLVFIGVLAFLATPLFMTSWYWSWRFENFMTDCGLVVCAVDMLPIAVYGISTFTLMVIFSLWGEKDG